jgi:hypothetical protein
VSDDYTTHVRESKQYGRLWRDGTFDLIGGYSDKSARDYFSEKSYELKSVPESLRPVLGFRRIVTTTDTYTPEPVDQP